MYVFGVLHQDCTGIERKFTLRNTIGEKFKEECELRQIRVTRNLDFCILYNYLVCSLHVYAPLVYTCPLNCISPNMNIPFYATLFCLFTCIHHPLLSLLCVFPLYMYIFSVSNTLLGIAPFFYWHFLRCSRHFSLSYSMWNYFPIFPPVYIPFLCIRNRFKSVGINPIIIFSLWFLLLFHNCIQCSQ